jgi:membrane protein
LGVLVVASIFLIILGNTLLSYFFNYFEIDRFSQFSIQLLRWIITFFLFYFGIALIYRFGISVKSKIKYFSPGATLATFLSIASSIIFAWYVNSFGAYNKLYGTIGTFIVIMLWIQINCFIILIGFELNAAIAVNRDLKKFITKKQKKLEKRKS